MGRLIDIENIDYVRLEDSLHCLEHHKGDEVECVICAPTVEAIPKADYEARLRADMVAMLTEIQLEIEEIEMDNNYPFGFEPVNKFYEGVSASSKLIQKKIDALKGEHS